MHCRRVRVAGVSQSVGCASACRVAGVSQSVGCSVLGVGNITTRRSAEDIVHVVCSHTYPRK